MTFSNVSRSLTRVALMHARETAVSSCARAKWQVTHHE